MMYDMFDDILLKPLRTRGAAKGNHPHAHRLGLTDQLGLANPGDHVGRLT
jgi:hypothetical protein